MIIQFQRISGNITPQPWYIRWLMATIGLAVLAGLFFIGIMLLPAILAVLVLGGIWFRWRYKKMFDQMRQQKEQGFIHPHDAFYNKPNSQHMQDAEFVVIEPDPDSNKSTHK